MSLPMRIVEKISLVGDCWVCARETDRRRRLRRKE